MMEDGEGDCLDGLLYSAFEDMDGEHRSSSEHGCYERDVVENADGLKFGSVVLV